MKIKRYIQFVNENKEYSTREQVASWLDEMDIQYYIINDDLSVDVNFIVRIAGHNLTEIPIKFNRIEENFLCYSNKLSTLKNCPSYVGGDFSCSANPLNNLDYSPKYVGGDFRCRSNHLTSLIGIPIEIKLEDLFCGENVLTENELKWNWLESIISENETNITFHLDWIKYNKKSMPKSFEDKFGYLLEFEHYTKILKN